MTETKKVIVWGREDALGEGVERILTDRDGWQVIGISDEHSGVELVKEVDRLHPEVVIIYLGDCGSGSGIAFRLMRDRPALKVVIVSLENNSLEIYSKQRVLIKELQDLMSVIEA